MASFEVSETLEWQSAEMVYCISGFMSCVLMTFFLFQRSECSVILVTLPENFRNVLKMCLQTQVGINSQKHVTIALA